MRTIVQIDGQNLFHLAKYAWGPSAPYHYLSYDVQQLAQALVAMAPGRTLAETHFSITRESQTRLQIDSEQQVLDEQAQASRVQASTSIGEGCTWATGEGRGRQPRPSPGAGHL